MFFERSENQDWAGTRSCSECPPEKVHESGCPCSYLKIPSYSKDKENDQNKGRFEEKENKIYMIDILNLRLKILLEGIIIKMSNFDMYVRQEAYDGSLLR